MGVWVVFAVCGAIILGCTIFDGSWRQTGWLLFQCSIIGAVAGSNIAWQWTPNQYGAVVLGVVAAYLATAIADSLLGDGEHRSHK